jgi:hypothetical protein
MKLAARIATGLIALLFLAMGVRWIVDPAGAAAGLGMELLTGLGASSQIGDFGAFFLSGGAMLAWAVRTGQAGWTYPPAIMVGAAAVMRTLAWATGNADFAAQAIVPEIIMTAIFVGSARLRAGEGD